MGVFFCLVYCLVGWRQRSENGQGLMGVGVAGCI